MGMGAALHYKLNALGSNFHRCLGERGIGHWGSVAEFWRLPAFSLIGRKLGRRKVNCNPVPCLAYVPSRATPNLAVRCEQWKDSILSSDYPNPDDSSPCKVVKSSSILEESVPPLCLCVQLVLYIEISRVAGNRARMRDKQRHR